MNGTLKALNETLDTRTGKQIAPPLQHQDSVNAVEFSPNGRTLATGSGDETARLWDARTGKPLGPPLKHQGAVRVVVFSPDGLALATSSGTYFSQPTVGLWDVRTGKPLASPLRIQDSALSIAFKPDGKSFVVATDHWLNTFSWDGKNAVPQNSQLLHGFWKKGLRFPANCEHCLQVALGDIGNCFHLETLKLEGPNDPPIEGDPEKLLKKWQARFGLTFNEEMRPVPR